MVLHSTKIVHRRKKQRSKSATGKINVFLKVLFHWEQIFFFKCFFLVSNVKLCEIYDKKEKSRKKVFHMGKKMSKCSLVILSALVIHTVPTVE
jgi:hypothetical protein